jgi:hypothetical protein
MDDDLALASLGHRFLDHVDNMVRVVRTRDVDLDVPLAQDGVLGREDTELGVVDDFDRVIVGLVVSLGDISRDGHVDGRG